MTFSHKNEENRFTNKEEILKEEFQAKGKGFQIKVTKGTKILWKGKMWKIHIELFNVLLSRSSEL